MCDHDGIINAIPILGGRRYTFNFQEGEGLKEEKRKTMKRQVMNKLLLAILNPIIYWWIYDTVIYLYLMIFITFKVNYDFFQVTFYELGPWSKNPTVATNKWEENKENQTKQRKPNKTKKTKQNKENKTKQIKQDKKYT